MKRLGLILALALAAPMAQAQGCARDPAAAFNAALAVTIGAVRGNDPQALLNQMSADGVSFGPEGEVVSLAELRAQFTRRDGRYCDLFACNGAEGPLHRLFVMGRIDRSVDTKHGLASVFINANSNDELDLSYKLSPSCRWELNGISAP
jgi:hypothetical protein